MFSYLSLERKSMEENSKDQESLERSEEMWLELLDELESIENTLRNMGRLG